MVHALQNALWIILFVIIPVHCTEYIYPVGAATTDDCTKIYLIYQKSPEHLELWLWDPVTKIAAKGLLSTYTPAGLQLLPEGQGFSFVDNGRIRVKEFTKRSPRTLAIDEPIYDISLVNWIDGESFYLSAKYNDNFGIFFGTIQGITTSLLHQQGTDFMYPQKIDEQIFYIERMHHEDQFLYSIKMIDYPSCQLVESSNFNDVEHFEQKASRLMQANKEQKIAQFTTSNLLIDHGTKPIIFLQMILENEGFFIEHPEVVYTHHAVLPCTFYHLININNSWTSKKLFNFSIPTHLLFGQHDSYLHESLLRFLPIYHNGTVVFCNSITFSEIRKKAISLDIFAYDVSTGQKKQISNARLGQFFMAPLVVQNTLYYGTAFSEYSDENIMWMSEDGEVCFELPCITLD